MIHTPVINFSFSIFFLGGFNICKANIFYDSSHVIKHHEFNMTLASIMLHLWLPFDQHCHLLNFFMPAQGLTRVHLPPLINNSMFIIHVSISGNTQSVMPILIYNMLNLSSKARGLCLLLYSICTIFILRNISVPNYIHI